MSPEMAMWAKALGSMGAGFFALNFWARWLRRKRTAPRWSQLIPNLVLGLLLISAAMGAYCQWKLMVEVPHLPRQAALKLTTYWTEYTRRTIQIGLASLSFGGVTMMIATLMAVLRKPPEVPPSSKRDSS